MQHQHITTAVPLDGVTPEVDHPRYGMVHEPILRLGDADLVFPTDPEAAAALALDMIDCLNEIRTDALRAAVTRQASPAEIRHERLTEGVAS